MRQEGESGLIIGRVRTFRSAVFFFVVAAVVAVLAPIAKYRSQFGTAFSTSQAVWGDFGDFVAGFSGTIIGLLGIIALVATLVVQQRQLTLLQEGERVRRLEETVGGLLDALQSILGDLDLRNKGREIVAQNRDVIRNIYTKKFKALYRARRARATAAGLSEEDFVQGLFDELYRRYGNDFGHYFRTLYRVIVTIDESATTDIEAKRLVSWLTCRLSRYEIVLLFYNCQGTIGRKKFYGLCHKYSLLEHLDAVELIRPQHLNLYGPEAYNQQRRRK